MSIEIRSQLGDVLLSGNNIWVTTDGSAPAAATQYKHLLRIVSTDGALIGSPIIDKGAPDSSNQFNFNIKARVNQPVVYDFEFPIETKAIAYDQLAFDITLEPGEEYIDINGDLQTVWSGDIDSHIVIKGGLSHLKQMEISPESFYDDFIKAGKFLTWQPQGAVIAPDQPQKLWYIYDGETINARFFILAFYDGDDGFTAEETFDLTIEEGELYEFNLDLDLWGIDAVTETHGKIRKIIVGIYDALLKSATMSEDRTFYFDHNYYDENTFVYYKNSIGGIDCLWCSGKTTELLSTETTMGTKPDAIMRNHKQPTQVVSSLTGQRTWQINTGFKSKDELAALRDFIFSDQMWKVDGENAIPVYLENKEQILAQLSRNLDSIEFTLLEAHIENHY